MTVTCVSCYYTIKNKHDNKYINWFKNTLKINCPYIFFTDSNENIEIINNIRKNIPTYYIICPFTDFCTYKYKDKFIIDLIHCPSKELNLIWNEKIFMLLKSSIINPFDSEWFFWIDAGICIYRDIAPPDSEFPDLNKIINLPQNKFIFSSSDNEYPDYDNIHVNINYHFIAGTSYLLHKKFINEFALKYIYYLDKLINENNIWTDQLILTHMFKNEPDLFYLLCNGYGNIIKYLF
jgi:hypothetical protein